MGGMRGDAAFSDAFDGPGLDTTVAAACEIADPEAAPRVSGIPSGVHAGPVSSTVGQQPFREHVRAAPA